MEAHQEVRLKQAEAADQKEAAIRDTFAEPTQGTLLNSFGGLSRPNWADKSRKNHGLNGEGFHLGRAS
jgi:hypothetical protein